MALHMKVARDSENSSPALNGGRAIAEGAELVAAAKRIVHSHCAVYTHPDVACSILDRVGWVASADLTQRRLLEPSCGDGSFLLPAVDRLLDSRRRAGEIDEAGLSDRIVAFEFDISTASTLRRRLVEKLQSAGLTTVVAKRIAARWLRCEDFLLAKGLAPFTDVVGNPPYMRWSKVPLTLRGLYEDNLPAHAARGDLCLAFICRAVELLAPATGRVAFLCSDRWLRCSYGSRARVEIEQTTRLTAHISVHDAPVFLGSRKVDAHAAVSLLERGSSNSPVVVTKASSIADLRRKLLPPKNSATQPSSVGLNGGQSAILAVRSLADAFQQIASTHAVLLDVGVEVRCGMALGCAPAFVVEETSEVEEERLVPFVRTSDLLDNGKVEPTSHVINVWEADGTLVKLGKYPKLNAHLKPYRTDLAKRACVKTPASWYRTIDRLDLPRVAAPKLLVAGMSKFARIAMSPGGAQPSNALYAITSTEWPLEALFALFRAGALDLFATVLAPRFAGDVKRFDGNVLRQVRIPAWSGLNSSLQRRLLNWNVETNSRDANLVLDVYRLSDKRLRKAVELAIAPG